MTDGEEVYQIRSDNTSVEYLIPDKFRNLHGYSFNVLLYNEKPRLYEKEDKYVGLELKFLEVVADATFEIMHSVDRSDENFLDSFIGSMINKSADFSMNTGIKDHYEQKVLENINTYEIMNYCGIIPNPPLVSFFDYILKPFDTVTWTFFLSSIVISMFVWRLINHFSLTADDSTLVSLDSFWFNQFHSGTIEWFRQSS